MTLLARFATDIVLMNEGRITSQRRFVPAGAVA
jgi:hypothetical protein